MIVMSTFLGHLVDIYDRTRALPAHTMKKITEALYVEFRDYESVLDVGVGTGKFAKPLQELGLEIVGIDISKKMLQKAVDKEVKSLMLADALNLPFRDLSFDCSMSVRVLHLVKDWRSALKEIERVTKKALVSILYEWPQTTPNSAYKKLLEEYGHSCRSQTLGEWELREIIKPLKSRFITSYETNADHVIDHLKEKAFSYQWNVPDDLHEKTMKEISREFAGMTYINKVYVCKWDIDKIKNYLES